jgi:hypothetical protein
MLDGDGAVKPQFAADYVVRGSSGSRVSNADRQRDHVDAFANRAPRLLGEPALSE